jgi:hypothetical protein
MATGAEADAGPAPDVDTEVPDAPEAPEAVEAPEPGEPAEAAEALERAEAAEAPGDTWPPGATGVPCDR